MTGEETPKARVRRRRVLRLVWMVPAMAIAVAAYLLWQRLQEYGPEVRVTFADGAGLRIGQTPLRYRGVQVGEVIGVGLSEDEKRAVVRIRLTRFGAGLAREGSRFWIVRPRVGFGQVTGLTTVLSGPEINVIPGKQGEPAQYEFTGLDNPPPVPPLKIFRVTHRPGRPKKNPAS